MDERVKLMAGSLVGAAAGVAIAYLFFTRDGRGLRRDLEPVLDDLLREAGRLQQAVQQVRQGLTGEDGPAWPRRSA